MQDTSQGSVGVAVRLLLPVALATTSGVLPAFLIGSQAVQLGRDLALSTGAVGAAVAVAWLVGSAASTPMGAASERLGGHRGLRIAALVSATAMAWSAVAGRSWGLLAVGAALGGCANSLAQPSANLLIARNLPVHRHGVAFGIKQGAIPVASMLGGGAVPVLTLTLGWRATFAAGAAFALVAAAAVPSAGRDRTAAVVDRPAHDAGAPPRPAGRPRGERARALVVLGCGVGLGAASAGALASFLVAGAVEVGMGEGVAGLVLMAGSVVGIALRLVLGARADRVGGDQLRVVSRLMVVGSASVLVYALGGIPGYVAATPLAFGAGWAWPGLFNLSVVRRYPEAPGAATGMTQTGTYLGAGLGPLAFGAVVDAVGWSAAWTGAAASMALAAVAVGIGRRMADAAPGATAGAH